MQFQLEMIFQFHGEMGFHPWQDLSHHTCRMAPRLGAHQFLGLSPLSGALGHRAWEQNLGSTDAGVAKPGFDSQPCPLLAQ